MNQEILRSLAALQGMQMRFNTSAADMYAMTGRDEPVRTMRHVVVPCGNGEFSIVDRTTDRTKAMCTGIDKAVRFAKRCEEAPVVEQQAKAPPHFGTLMLYWTAALSVAIGLFAFFGAHP